MTIVGVYLSFALLAVATVELSGGGGGERCWKRKLKKEIASKRERENLDRDGEKAVASSTHTHNVLGADNCTVSCESGRRPMCAGEVAHVIGMSK